MEPEHPYTRALRVAALAAAVTCPFFSISLTYVAGSLAWLALFASRVPGKTKLGVALPNGLVVPAACFLAASALSAALGVVPADGLAMVGKEVFWFGLALLAASATVPKLVRGILVLFLAVAAVAGLYGLYQVIVQFGGRLDLNHRAYGFWHPGAYVSYSNVLAMAFAIALGFAFWARGRIRLLGLAAALAAVVGMVTSYTRGGWLVSVALVGLAALWRRLVVPLVVVGVLVVAMAMLPGSNPATDLVARARSAFDPSVSQNTDRLARYRTAVDVISDYPLLGTGPRGLRLVYPRYERPGSEGNSHLHNTYLQLMAERGPLALLAWITTIGWGLVRALGAARRPWSGGRDLAAAIGLALGAMMLLSVVNYLWEDWRIRALTLVLLGLAWAPAVSGVRADRRAVDQQTPARSDAPHPSRPTGTEGEPAACPAP